MILNQITQKKCEIHKMMDLTFAAITPEYPNGQYCQVCILKDRINPSDLISIPELKSQQQTQPIQNWPFGIKQSSLDYLSEELSINKKEQIKADINSFYKDFQSQVFSALEESREQAQLQLEQCPQVQQDLIEFYNEKFKRNELQQMFSNPQEFSIDKYFDFLKGLEISANEDLKQLSESIKIIKKIEEQLSIGKCSQIKQVILNVISKIQLIASPLPKEDTNNNQNENFFENKIEVLSNFIINHIQNSKYENLYSQEKSLRRTDSKGRLLTREEEVQETFKQFRWNQKQKVIESVNLADVVSQKNESLTQMKQIVEDLYREYCQQQEQNQELDSSHDSRESDQSDNQIEQDQNINNTANKMKFINSQNSSQVDIFADEDNNVEIQSGKIIDLFSAATIYSNIVLDSKKCYTIRYLFNKPYFKIKNTIYIGLIENSRLNNPIMTSSSIFFDRSFGNFFSVSGQSEIDSSAKQNIYQLEMRICLDKNIIMCSDYPKYNYVFSNKMLPLKEIYRFGIRFQCNIENIHVTIAHFEESNNFVPF